MKYNEVDVYSLVARIKKIKAENKERARQNQLGVNTYSTPWKRGCRRSQDVWQQLDKVYEWFMQDEDPVSSQAYRRVAEAVAVYDPLHNTKRTWNNAIEWVEEHGDPHRNKEWSQWRASLDTVKY